MTFTRAWASMSESTDWDQASVCTKISAKTSFGPPIIFVCNFFVPCSFHPLSEPNWAFWSPIWWTLLDYIIGCKTFASRKPSEVSTILWSHKIAICKYLRTQDATIFTDKAKVLCNKKFHDSLSLCIIVSTRAN
jgi:hypothetical protein